MKRTNTAIAVMLIAAGSALATDAQVLDKKTLTLDGARKAIAGSVAYAHKNSAAGVIAVVDDGGNLMALERLDGTFAAGANISIGKARTAVLFKKPTRFFEEVVGKGRTAMVALNDFTPLQGGIPLMVDGEIVGGVGVSGAASAAQDEELALAGAAALSTPDAAVVFFDHDRVSSAFAKGEVLFDGSDQYMVHASRLEQAGMAEIHTRDADIVYVLDGTATLVTGGSAVDTKTTAPDEIRGSRIEGGESHQLRKGDVIIVPAGVPH